MRSSFENFYLHSIVIDEDCANLRQFLNTVSRSFFVFSGLLADNFERTERYKNEDIESVKDITDI